MLGSSSIKTILKIVEKSWGGNGKEAAFKGLGPGPWLLASFYIYQQDLFHTLVNLMEQ